MRKAGPAGHVMNLGHGIEAATPEEKDILKAAEILSYFFLKIAAR